MKIKSFGCSFIFGSELPDTIDREFGASAMTWPALMAQNLRWQYQCFAWPGRGNLYIADRVLEQAAEYQPGDVFVINWTWVDRFDYFDEKDSWSSVLPQDRSKTADSYHRYLHSQKRDKLASLLYIHSCVAELEKQSIPYVMTYMDHILEETRWHTDPAITSLQQSVLKKLHNFPGGNFLEWSKQQGYPVSDLWHPLQQAHAQAAQVMMPFLQQALQR